MQALVFESHFFFFVCFPKVRGGVFAVVSGAGRGAGAVGRPTLERARRYTRARSRGDQVVARCSRAVFHGPPGVRSGHFSHFVFFNFEVLIFRFGFGLVYCFAFLKV